MFPHDTTHLNGWHNETDFPLIKDFLEISVEMQAFLNGFGPEN
jgi:hypothetical protein